jgi:hypothetical protein
MWICVIVVAVMWIIYAWYEPVGGRNGGTRLGYVYGGIATAAIIYLMWYGIRKRSYYARYTTLRGTLAAHVWIGLSLIIIVPLHCGFSFGFNVHTLTYVLMLVVILSGIWGTVLYTKLPFEILSQRGGGTLKLLLEEVEEISNDINQMAGLNQSDVGVSLRSDIFLGTLQKIDFLYKPSLRRSLLKDNPQPIDQKRTAELLRELPEKERKHGFKLIGLVNRKRELVCRIQDEARALTWVKAWLYVHLPVSFGLLVALAIHIFSVYYYR